MSKEEVLKELEELKNKWMKMREKYGERAINDALASSPEAQLLTKIMEDVHLGRIPEEQAQQELEKAQELVDRSLLTLPDDARGKAN